MESEPSLPLSSLLLVLPEELNELDEMESWVGFCFFVGSSETVVGTVSDFLLDFSMALWLTHLYPFCVWMVMDRRYWAYLLLMIGSWWRPSRAQPNSPR